MRFRLSLYFHTIRHLTLRQVYFRLYYFVKNRIYPLKPYIPRVESKVVGINPKVPFSLKQGIYLGVDGFCFLNISHQFSEGIDWEFDGYGKLWTYHLNYFDYLLDESCSQDEAFRLMHEYRHSEPGLRVGKMPYPVSLRIFNWVKVMIRFGRFDAQDLGFLRCDLAQLYSNVEYHVLGNHLLENALALVFGGMAVNEKRYLDKGMAILNKQLKVQLLDDGGHFERSPMYQQILLERMLDCINLSENMDDGQKLRILLEPFVLKMFHWLVRMTFSNGDIAMVNDATHGMSMTTRQLLDYGLQLGFQLSSRSPQMLGSGYRRYDRGSFECIVDSGDVGPDYLLAHAHSDTLSFCLYVDGSPLVLDTGTSTYQSDAIRQRERSTSAHNTVCIDGREQSDAWGAFRMAHRAHARILEEGDWHMKATHDGYDRIGARHTRSFRLEQDRLIIEDIVRGGKMHEAFLHFAPGLEPYISEEGAVKVGSVFIRISGANSLHIETYDQAKAFNRRIRASRLRISFTGHLTTVCSKS